MRSDVLDNRVVDTDAPVGLVLYSAHVRLACLWPTLRWFLPGVRINLECVLLTHRKGLMLKCVMALCLHLVLLMLSVVALRDIV